MFVRNFLSAGDYMEIVPFGLPITLQYDVNGILEKILFKYDNEASDITDVMLKKILKEKIAPRKISVKTGTTWVVGVLYTSDHPSSIGSMPDDAKEEYLESFSSGSSDFKFYAGNVTSMPTTFRGAVPTRQWLTMSGFQVLPGYVVPSGLVEDKFDKMILNRNFPFQYPLIQGYFIFRYNSVTYYNLGFKQDKVVKSSNIVDDEGHVKVQLHLSSGEDNVVDYSEYVRMNLQNGVIIVKDESDKIIYSLDTKPERSTLASRTEYRMNCPVCGKVYTFNPYRPVICPDEHCNSRLYHRVNYFLSVLGLDTISKDRYDEITTSVGSIFSIPDVLDSEEYKDKKLDVKLSVLLRAIVPEEVIAKHDAFNSFCNRCNNSVESVMYYIDNPDKANYDLKLYESNTSYVKFLKWVASKENAMDIHSLLMNPNITLIESNKTLPGVAQIFRGNKILITGRFRHGSDEKIQAILGSYGAEVVTRYNKDISFVIIGDTKENISGPATTAALRDRKIIYEEGDFFKRFEIDEDLAENL